MAKVYKVYDVEKNELFLTRQHKQEAIDDVDNLCNTDGVSGWFEVHEFDEAHAELPPVRVYKRHA